MNKIVLNLERKISMICGKNGSHSLQRKKTQSKVDFSTIKFVKSFLYVYEKINVKLLFKNFTERLKMSLLCNIYVFTLAFVLWLSGIAPIQKFHKMKSHQQIIMCIFVQVRQETVRRDTPNGLCFMDRDAYRRSSSVRCFFFVFVVVVFIYI